jgi:hypothetical protein
VAGQYFDAPPEVVDEVRAVCSTFPEVLEQKAWAGVRWRIRASTFAHVLDTDYAGPLRTVLTFRSSGEELLTLQNVGHPYVPLPWGVGAMGLVVTPETDWSEVAELLAESYCLRAPKKLAALLR